MRKQTEKVYALPPDISISDLRDAMERLKDDAEDQFTPLARSYTLHGSPENKARAMFYAGQIEILKSMLWALSGEAQADGCEPTIGIRHPD